MNLYQAINEMRRISAAGGTFAISFRKYNRQASNGGQLVTIRAARLRPAASDSKVANASHKLFLTDTDSARAINCWQPLIVQFNGQLVQLT